MLFLKDINFLSNQFIIIRLLSIDNNQHRDEQSGGIEIKKTRKSKYIFGWLTSFELDYIYGPAVV